MAERPHQTPPLPVPPEPDPKPTPPPRPKPAPSGGRLKAARFQGPDGQPDPTLQACADDQARLREGDSGGPVAMVQRALLDTGGPSLGTSGPDGDGVDAVYGPKTAAAVRAFKAREELGFEQFGDVGPGTMHRLDELLA